jgi:hypothetical protein
MDFLLSSQAFQPQHSHFPDDLPYQSRGNQNNEGETTAYYQSVREIQWQNQENGTMMMTLVGIIGKIKHITTPIVLYSYGSQTHSHQRALFEELASFSEYTGIVFIVYDYPGYGPKANQPYNQQKSGGWMEYFCRIWSRTSEYIPFHTEQTMLNCTDEVYLYVKQQFPLNPLFLWGRSLGCVATCYLLDRYKKDGIKKAVLQSPFSSAMQTVWTRTSVPSFADGFNNYERLSKMRKEDFPPLYVLVGLADTLVTPENTTRLIDMLEKKPLKVRNRHGDCTNAAVTVEGVEGVNHNQFQIGHYKSVLDWLKA